MEGRVNVERLKKVLKRFRSLDAAHAVQHKLCEPPSKMHQKKSSNKSDIKNISFINFSSPIFMFIVLDTLTEPLLLFLLLLSYHFLYLFDINVWPAWWVIVSYNIFPYIFVPSKNSEPCPKIKIHCYCYHHCLTPFHINCH